MKTIFIEARYKGKITLPNKLIDKLPNSPASVALFTTVQFISSLKNIKKQLIKNNKKTILIKTKHTKYDGQILGCNTDDFSGEIKKHKIGALLYIGDGLFHPKALLIKNKDIDIFCYNPFSKKHFRLTKKDVEIIEKKRKAGLLKFYSSEHIGVLVSLKHGQQCYKEAKKLEQKFKDKTFYYLAFDTLDFSELENFPFIECFVNTACPRIGYDDSEKMPRAVVDIGDLL